MISAFTLDKNKDCHENLLPITQFAVDHFRRYCTGKVHRESD